MEAAAKSSKAKMDEPSIGNKTKAKTSGNPKMGKSNSAILHPDPKVINKVIDANAWKNMNTDDTEIFATEFLHKGSIQSSQSNDTNSIHRFSGDKSYTK